MTFSKSFFSTHKTALLLVVLSVIFYSCFAYHLLRTDYTILILLYSFLFLLFYKTLHLLKNDIALLTVISFIFRAVFIMAMPNLSQDFYRFIWDGRMIVEGFNPYLYTPDYFMQIGHFPIEQGIELYEGMGSLSAGHFTNYPPINQLFFTMAGLFSNHSILGSALILRLIIIAADFGTLYFGKKLLVHLNIPVHHIFWYVLNPFIIIELTGNLHFEGVMIFFLIWSLYLLHQGKWQLSAFILALSISIKLIPLIFLPLFYKWFVSTGPSNQISTEKKSISKHEESISLTSHNDEKKWTPNVSGITKLIVFYAIVVITNLLLFTPFYSHEFIRNYTETVGLWFHNFEFNASIYYIARSIGYTFRGYNEIAIIGKITAFSVVLFVLIFTFLSKNKTATQLITTMLFVLSFYYFTATTVHPWYIATLIILSVFTKYKFPLVWSFVIIFSYLAYANVHDQENLWIIALEYVLVYSVFIWEVFIKKLTKNVA